MKISLEFGNLELETIIRAHLKREGFLPDNKQASISFRLVSGSVTQVIAVAEVTPIPTSPDYMDR